MTAQQPEILIIDEEEMMMTTNPDLNDKASCGCLGLSTGNYRGYVGTWEIKNNKLYLNSVEGAFMKEEGPIFADWVSHELHVWNGNLLRYVHAGYGSMYEEDIFFDIENGILKGTRAGSNIGEFKKQAIEEIQRSSNKTNISFLYSIYLDPVGELSRLIEKSTDRKQEYIDFQKELELEFKKRLSELAKDPASGISLVYK